MYVLRWFRSFLETVLHEHTCSADLASTVTTSTVFHALQAGDGGQALTRQLILLLNYFPYRAPKNNRPYIVEHITRCFGSLFASLHIMYVLRWF